MPTSPHHPRFAAELTDRITSKLQQRMNAEIGHRGDLFFSEVKRINDSSVWAMIGYDRDVGPRPTSKDVTAFVVKNLKGAAQPVLGSMRIHPDHDAITTILEKPMVTRPVQDVKGMMAVVAGAVYIDQNLGDRWEVRTNATGEKFLMRTAEDDVEALVAERTRRLASASRSEFCLAAALSSGLPNLNVGDKVKAYYMGEIHDDCTIAGLSENEVVLNIAGYGKVSTGKEAVINVVAVSPAENKKMKEELREYFEKAYGDPKYAAELTKETTRG